VRKHISLLFGLVLIIAFTLFSMPLSATDSELDIEIGDYWEYISGIEYSDEQGNLTADLIFKMEVEDIIQRTIDGSLEEVFVIDLNGSASAAMDIDEFDLFPDLFEDMEISVSSTIHISGSQERLASNFSHISTEIEIYADADMMMDSITVSFPINGGGNVSFSPALNDYLGNEEILVDIILESESRVTGDLWFAAEIMGDEMDESIEIDDNISISMVVIAENISIEVPAGTFDCYKVLLTSPSEGDIDSPTIILYYSEEVGNYVKVEITDLGMIEEQFDSEIDLSEISIELNSYSHGDTGFFDDIFSAFAGDNVFPLLILIAAVIIIIVVTVMLRSRR